MRSPSSACSPSWPGGCTDQSFWQSPSTNRSTRTRTRASPAAARRWESGAGRNWANLGQGLRRSRIPRQLVVDHPQLITHTPSSETPPNLRHTRPRCDKACLSNDPSSSRSARTGSPTFLSYYHRTACSRRRDLVNQGPTGVPEIAPHHLIHVHVNNFGNVKRKQDVQEQNLVAPDDPLFDRLCS